MTLLKTFAGLVGLTALTACGQPGPSVPFAQGQNMEVARAAVDTCSVFAPRGGQNRVTTMYVANAVLWGIVPGVIGTAIAEPNIRQRGQASAVDGCLEDRGFSRRDLTSAEIIALDTADPTTRAKLLDHLVMGGQLETFSGI
jgi:hypothetical protein